jgi:hypothetical protein
MTEHDISTRLVQDLKRKDLGKIEETGYFLSMDLYKIDGAKKGRE